MGKLFYRVKHTLLAESKVFKDARSKKIIETSPFHTIGGADGGRRSYAVKGVNSYFR